MLPGATTIETAPQLARREWRVMNIDDFWKPGEKEITSFSEAVDLIHGVFDDWSSKGSVFAWRGQVNASWALHSSLYRRLMWTKVPSPPPDEKALEEEEAAILAEAHRWGLHTGASGRLSALCQLAMLQHYGAPTRLIDVTFNPFIGLWFAVEKQWENGSLKDEDKDGRLFAIDVSKRLINEDEERRRWEDDNRRPWPRATDNDKFRESTTSVLAWRPARFDHRIAAQNGGFLLGGAPGSSSPNGPAQWLKDPTKPGDRWTINEVRQALSVALRINKIDAASGRDPNNPTYTVRIKSSAKPEIREHLQVLYGYRHATIYPDYPGFSLYGRPGLKSRP